MSATTTASPTPAIDKPPAVTDAIGPIVYFDGVCGLCNRSVDLILGWDRQGVFKFAPLQGETAAARLSSVDTQDLGSLILQNEGRTFRQSSAVVRILWRLGGFARMIGTLLWLIPRPLRDIGYRAVAANRYRFFGKKDACRMPTPEERVRFLP